MNISASTVQRAAQQSRRREQQLVFARANLPGLLQTTASIFEPDAAGQVATHIPFALPCLFCEQDLQGERIKLVEYGAGRCIRFHTDEGHQLVYKGSILQRVECGAPVAARVVALAGADES